MKVGLITIYDGAFLEFKKANPNFECYQVSVIEDLWDFTADFYIRLEGCEKVDESVLQTIDVQEKLRGLKPSKPITFDSCSTNGSDTMTFSTGLSAEKFHKAMEDMSKVVHPMARYVVPILSDDWIKRNLQDSDIPDAANNASFWRSDLMKVHTLQGIQGKHANMIILDELKDNI